MPHSQPQATPVNVLPPQRPGRRAAAFTLVEMMVAVSLLVVIMLAVGQIFKSTTTAINVGQSTMEMMSDVRSFQEQIARDLHHLDTRGYLVIRSQPYVLNANPPGTPAGTTGMSDAGVPIFCDQIAFMSHGTFTHRTGSDGSVNGSTPLQDYLQSNSAAIWYGQLVTGYTQATAVPQGALPPANGDAAPGAALNSIINATPQSFLLGRHRFLLGPNNNPNPAPGPNNNPPGSPPYMLAGGLLDRAYEDIRYPAIVWPTSGNVIYPSPAVSATTTEPAADITSSRLDAATLSPQQVMSIISQVGGSTSAEQQLIADAYCYRFGAVANVYASTHGVVNGYFRMTPIIASGIYSMQISWTPQVQPAIPAPASGTAQYALTWYGYAPAVPPSQQPTCQPACTSTDAGAFPVPVDQEIGVTPGAAAANTADPNGTYLAVFNQSNRSEWPAAIKITYSVIDPGGNLTGGRTFTQVIDLPR